MTRAERIEEAARVVLSVLVSPAGRPVDAFCDQQEAVFALRAALAAPREDGHAPPPERRDGEVEMVFKAICADCGKALAVDDAKFRSRATFDGTEILPVCASCWGTGSGKQGGGT